MGKPTCANTGQHVCFWSAIQGSRNSFFLWCSCTYRMMCPNTFSWETAVLPSSLSLACHFESLSQRWPHVSSWMSHWGLIQLCLYSENPSSLLKSDPWVWILLVVVAGTLLGFVLRCPYQGLQCTCCTELYWAPTLMPCYAPVLVETMCRQPELVRQFLVITVLVSVSMTVVLWMQALSHAVTAAPVVASRGSGFGRWTLKWFVFSSFWMCLLFPRVTYIAGNINSKQLFELNCRNESYPVYVGFTCMVLPPWYSYTSVNGFLWNPWARGKLSPQAETETHMQQLCQECAGIQKLIPSPHHQSPVSWHWNIISAHHWLVFSQGMDLILVGTSWRVCFAMGIHLGSRNSTWNINHSCLTICFLILPKEESEFSSVFPCA